MSHLPDVPKRLESGILVALEGIDGAGKTTQAKRLTTLLRDTGLDVVSTKEPTNGPWGRKLRESAKLGRLSAEEELDLFIRDRKEHVEKLLLPALKAGKVVIVDRYYFSNVAYQGARGMERERILALNEAFAPPPDLLVLIEVTPEQGLRRIHQRGDKGNLFEEESSLRAVAEVFATMSFPYMQRVDGTKPVEAISLEILERLYSGLLSTRDLKPESTSLPKGADEPSNIEVWEALSQSE